MRSLAVDLVRAVMDFHGIALARIVEVVSRDAGMLRELLEDDLIASALVLHGVHPDEVPARVNRALDKLSRYFDSRGARVELVEFDSDRIRIRYSGKHGASETRQMIEDAICEAAPEIVSIVVEGIEELPESSFVPLSALTMAHV
jgi:hypothetical protein